MLELRWKTFVQNGIPMKNTSQFAPQGWYEKAEKTMTLDRPFSW
jgi:hypothetical protein